MTCLKDIVVVGNNHVKHSVSYVFSNLYDSNYNMNNELTHGVLFNGSVLLLD